MADLEDLDTPTVTVDLDRLQKNVERMANSIRAAGVGIRPHTKTHKTPEIARMQLDNGADGITVAKLGEAEIMVEAGFDDILIANEVIGRKKLGRLAHLSRRAKVRSCTDSLAGAAMLSEAAIDFGTTFEVLLDVNTGLDRTGVEAELAVELGRRIDELPGLKLVGVFSYAGYKPGVPDREERRRWAVGEASAAVSVSRQLLDEGFGAEEVSVAGTPTAEYAASVPGITEVRPGTYVFYDVNYARMGVCDLSQCALKIRARVISRPASDRAVIDAGSKVLTTEKRGDGAEDPGYGHIEGFPGTHIEALWEEHGVLRLDAEGRQLEVGDVLEIIPNHVCPTVNLADVWYGVRSGTVEQEFPIAARGRTS